MLKINTIDKSNSQKLLITCFNKVLKNTKINKYLKKNIKFKNKKLFLIGKKISIKNNLYIAGWGKLSPYLAQSFSKLVGTNNIKKGLFITNRSYPSIKNIKFLKGSHPIPNINTYRSSMKMLKFLTSIDSNSHLVFLISGGGSSQFSIPANNIKFSEKKEITRKLITNGIEPKIINNIRKFISKIKGGKLLRYLKVKNVYNILISDENQNLFHSIASGSTILQKWNFQKLKKEFKILKTKSIISNNLIKKIFNLMKKHESYQKKNKIYEKLIQLNNDKYNLILEQKTQFKKINVFSQIILNNYQFRRQLAKIIKQKSKIKVLLSKNFFFGDYNKNKKKILLEVKKIKLNNFFLILGSQIEINIAKNKDNKISKGGRLQHLCLDLANELKKEKINNFEISGLASDGDDYLKNIAGATISKKEISALSNKKISSSIECFSSYKILNQLKSLIYTIQPTENNVMDVIVLFIKRK